MTDQQRPSTSRTDSESGSQPARADPAPMVTPASGVEESMTAEAEEQEVDIDMRQPRERTATAPTPPGADIQNMRPVDDPDSLGGSKYYPGGETLESSAPPPVQVTEDP